MKILGHRGDIGKGRYYDNTLEGYESALRHADGLEADAVHSLDRTVYLIHDTNYVEEVQYEIRRHLNEESEKKIGHNRLDQTPDQLIKELVVKNNAPIPKLSELIKLNARYNKFLDIELKGEKVAKSVISELSDAIQKGYLTKEQILLSAFNHSQLYYVKENAPGYKYAPVFANHKQRHGERTHPWSETDFGEYIPFYIDYAVSSYMRELKPDYMVLDVWSVTRENITKLIEAFPNLKIFTWDLYEPPIQDNRQIIKIFKDPLIRSVMQGCITNYPGLMRSYLKSNGIEI